MGSRDCIVVYIYVIQSLTITDNHIGGVMVSVLTSSAVARTFESLVGLN